MGSILLAIGSIVAIIGWIWLIIVGFKAGGVLWGILNIIFQPITGLIFCITQKTGWQQFGIMVAGWLLAIIGIVLGGGGTYEVNF